VKKPDKTATMSIISDKKNEEEILPRPEAQSIAPKNPQLNEGNLGLVSAAAVKDSMCSDEDGASSPVHDWLEFPEGVDCFDYGDMNEGEGIDADGHDTVVETSLKSCNNVAIGDEEVIRKSGPAGSKKETISSRSPGSSPTAGKGTSHNVLFSQSFQEFDCNADDILCKTGQLSDDSMDIYDSRTVRDMCNAKPSHRMLGDATVDEKKDNGNAKGSKDGLLVVGKDGCVNIVRDSLSEDSDKTPVKKADPRKSFGLACGAAWSSVTCDETIDEGKGDGAKVFGKAGENCRVDEMASRHGKGSVDLLGERQSKLEKVTLPPERRYDADGKDENCSAGLGSAVNSHVKGGKTVFKGVGLEGLIPEWQKVGVVENILGGEDTTGIINRERAIAKLLLCEEDSNEEVDREKDIVEHMLLKDNEVRVSETEVDTSSETEALSVGASDCELEGHRPGVVSETDMDVDSDDQEEQKNESMVRETNISKVQSVSGLLGTVTSEDDLDNTFVSQRKSDNFVGTSRNFIREDLMSVQHRRATETSRTRLSSSSSDEAPLGQQFIRRDQWACHVCTFINHADLPYCEMCEAKRKTPMPSSSSRKPEKRKIKRRSSYVAAVTRFDPNLDDSDDDFTDSMPSQIITYQKASASLGSKYSKYDSSEESERDEGNAVRKSSQSHPKKRSKELRTSCESSDTLSGPMHLREEPASCSHADTSLKTKSTSAHEGLSSQNKDRLVRSDRSRNKARGLPMDFIDPSDLFDSEAVDSEPLFTENDSGDDYVEFHEDFGSESESEPSPLVEEDECMIEDTESDQDDTGVSSVFFSRKDKGKRLSNSHWPDMKSTFLLSERNQTNVPKEMKRTFTSTKGTVISLDPDLLSIGTSKVHAEGEQSGSTASDLGGVSSAISKKVPRRKIRSGSIEVDPDLTDVSKEEQMMQIDESDSDCDIGNTSAADAMDADISDDDDPGEVVKSSPSGPNTAAKNGASVSCDIDTHSLTGKTDGASTKSSIRYMDSCSVNRFVTDDQAATYHAGACGLSSPIKEEMKYDDMVAKELKAAVELFSPKSSFRSARKVLGVWLCNKCGYENDADDDDCDECFCPKPVAKTSPLEDSSVGSRGVESTKHSDGRERTSGGWRCQECGLQNCASDAKCFSCKSHQPNLPLEETKSVISPSLPNEEKLDPSFATGVEASGPSKLRQNQYGDVDAMLGDLDAIFCRKSDPNQATWTCLQCGHQNVEEDDMCDECFLKRGEKSPQGCEY
jgi:rubrerythrin